MSCTTVASNILFALILWVRQTETAAYYWYPKTGVCVCFCTKSSKSWIPSGLLLPSSVLPLRLKAATQINVPKVTYVPKCLKRSKQVTTLTGWVQKNQVFNSVSNIQRTYKKIKNIKTETGLTPAFSPFLMMKAGIICKRITSAPWWGVRLKHVQRMYTNYAVHLRYW